MFSYIEFKGKKLVVAISHFLFLLYIAIAAVLLFFSSYRQEVRFGRNEAFTEYNLVPFQTIMNYINATGYINTSIVITNLAGNILAFMPLGFFLPLLFKRYLKFRNTIFVVIASTFSVECLQYYFRVGSFDVDDLILNTVGGILGFGVFKLVSLVLKLFIR
ncbi:VanZ family protein [Mesobacillus maritimus]|uniref:VanZ family protein n=1 Tax=Mesobacillus maritimus TaxID=1643336 RepID=A0ABS7K4F1_9BACI|nr:VanZ family protein [Mesobacillus maritimus]MBY0097127.1 VanZ family protein [Mesobacillus maritimus]